MSFQHSLPNALSYADDGSVITFRGNIDITADSTDAYKNLVADKDITIDLAGYSLTSTVGAALTITSNTTIQNGTVSMSSMGGVALIVSGEGAKLTLSGAEVQATGTASSGISVASSAAFVMTGGSITAQSGNGVLLASGTTAAITGGTISAYWPVNITGQTSFISGSVDATTGAITSVPTFVATGTYTGQDPYDSLKLVDGWTLVDVDKTDASQGKTLAYDFSQVSVSLVPNSSTYTDEWQSATLTVKMKTTDGTITLPRSTYLIDNSSTERTVFKHAKTYTMEISPTNTDHYLSTTASVTYVMNRATPDVNITLASASDSTTDGKLDATMKITVEGVNDEYLSEPYGTCSLQYKKTDESTWTSYSGSITSSNTESVGDLVFTATLSGLDEDSYDFKAIFTPVDRVNWGNDYASNTGTQTLQIAKGAAGVTISGAPASVTYGDADFELTATVLDAGTGTGTYTWVSSDSSILSVTPDTTDPSKAVVKVLKADSTGAKISVAYESSSTEGSAETASIPVNQKTLTVSGVSAADKTYDGTTTAAITGTATLSGVVSGDSVSVDSTNAKASFTDKNVGTGKTVTFSGYTLTGADAANYTLTQPAIATASISPKEVTPVWDTSYAYTKVYDGTKAAGSVAQLDVPSNAACANDVLMLAGDSSTTYQFNSENVSEANKISVSVQLLIVDTSSGIPSYNTTDNYVLAGYEGTVTVDGTTYYTYTHAGTITKATPMVSAWPTTGSINFGQTVADSALTGGTASTDGAFTWSVSDASKTPTVVDSTGAPGDSDATQYAVIFTPSSSNYETVNGALTIHVNPYGTAPNVPSVISAPYTNTTLAGVTLPAGWEWTDSTTALEVGTPVTAMAKYTAADAGNYATTEAQVTVTRSACTHPASMQEVRNAKAATATEDGYTGDVWCTQCGELISYGSVIPATGTESDDAENKDKLAATGDATTPLAGVMLALAGSALACAGITTRRRKEQ